MKLTDKTIKNAKPKDKPYKLADGGGMYLEVMPNGSKLWRIKYRYLGKETRMSLGAYPLVSLAEARDKRDTAKRQLMEDVKPAEAKQERRRQLVRDAANTFEAVAREWHDHQKSKWSDDHSANTMRRLELDIFPYLGARPVAKITAPELLDTLKKIEKRDAHDISHRVRGICNRIFNYAIITGRCQNNPASALAGALKTRKTTHFAAIEAKEIPELLSVLEKNDARLFARTRRMIKLSLLTFVRPGELRQAQWDEIDFKAMQWEIPAERMKMRRAHIVPLSKQSLALLQEQREETGHINTPYVFPSIKSPKQPMSDGTVLVALKRMGFKDRMTAHGFRALARTTIREKLDYEPDVIESQLAHKAAGALGEAYNRAQHLTKRKKMMQDWADLIDKMSKTGQVVVGNFKRKAS